MEKNALIEMHGITKKFGGVTALDKVDFEVYPNEVVGLVGDNGAGKSTLVKVLAGVFSPEEGEIKIESSPFHFEHPSEALAKGIQVIYQDLSLVETFDMPSNFFLGQELMKEAVGGVFKQIDRKKMKNEALTVVRDKLGIDIQNWFAPVRVLSGGQRQAIAVARSVYTDAKLIVMDEPTAALGVSEAEKLFDMIKRLKEQHISFVVIAHNLEHVFAVTDRIVVLSRGRLVGVRKTSETSRDEVVQMMLT